MGEKLPDGPGADSRRDVQPSKTSRPCPICGKPAIVEMRPFCSKRCANVDLHRWLGGTYAIPVVEENGGRDDPDDDS